MRIAISTVGDTLDSMLDPHFGRAARFVIIDHQPGAGALEESPWRPFDNSARTEQPSGAGVATVQALAGEDVDAVITGQLGPKAEDALRHAGITAYLGATGTARDALAAYAAGELRATGG